MNCEDIRQAIYVYLDGEFAPGEAAEVERHLRGCTPCRELATRESEFLVLLRKELKAPAAPTSLRSKVLGGMEAQDAARGATTARARLLRWTAPLAAAAGLAVAVGWALGGPGQVEVATAQEVVATHRQDLPMEVRGSIGNIEHFLNENARFDALIPFRGDAEVKLVGARLTQIEGQPAVVFNYDFGGRRLTVLQRPQREAIDGPEGYEVADHQGYRVVTFRTGRVTNSVVGAVGSGEVGRLLVPVAYRGAGEPR